ncbi:hypothetical protein [Lysinibacillus parviboronicapiens]|uniref:hypothetical protein n=1 Tax=Lysinibacillus parviboronicapiens TaxID=436516 RepID=UPI00187D37A2|nr:hypothetical protein [Lysinibacillus parviboronicapiens]
MKLQSVGALSYGLLVEPIGLYGQFINHTGSLTDRLAGVSETPIRASRIVS